MSSLINLRGDILDSDAQYIAHQTNCVSLDSAGLARKLFDRFPYADVYALRVPGERAQPGTVVVSGDGSALRYVIHMMGQVYPGKPKYPDSETDGVRARKVYFHSCLKQIAAIPDLNSVAFPYGIGCGLAGGDWGFYFDQLEKFAAHLKGRATVQIYQLNK